MSVGLCGRSMLDNRVLKGTFGLDGWAGSKRSVHRRSRGKASNRYQRDTQKKTETKSRIPFEREAKGLTARDVDQSQSLADLGETQYHKVRHTMQACAPP